jgi:2-oxopent-4-enoate/cis-2-oxohex-4-enoate hydratase
MDEARIEQHAAELYAALRSRKTIAPLTSRAVTSDPGSSGGAPISIHDAYQISLRLLSKRQADGEILIGKKIGVTSKAVQDMLDVRQPDFGFLTDRMRYDDGAELPISSQMIQPRAEGELAFVLKHKLQGPGITPDDVIAATDYVSPCFEIVDSRIADWKIRIQDTVADNASSGLFLLGEDRVAPQQIDFFSCGMVVEKNGEVLSTGAGAAALGSPLICVAWLANTLGQYGVSLDAGEVILSGSLVPLEPVAPGDAMRVTIGGIGSATVRFV